MDACSPRTHEICTPRIRRFGGEAGIDSRQTGHFVTYATLREIVRRMATLPGQRSLLLVSDGFLPIEGEADTRSRSCWISQCSPM